MAWASARNHRSWWQRLIKIGRSIVCVHKSGNRQDIRLTIKEISYFVQQTRRTFKTAERVEGYYGKDEID